VGRPKLPVYAVRLKALRKEKKWSVQDLADLSGLSPNTIDRVEGGHAPSLRTLQAVCQVFKIAVHKLLEP
jgi:transcriptional regulator with XRE-family HTH domain